MSGAGRSLSDFFSIFGGKRAPDVESANTDAALSSHEPAYSTKALAKFLKTLKSRENPALIDLGPVVGSNITFFGEHYGCRIRVEDIAADIDRHVTAGRVEHLPKFFESRFPQEAQSVDGVLCWDVFDFLERPAALALAASVTRLLRPEGALLGFFSTADARAQVYTKFVIVDESNLRYRTCPASRPRQKTLQNRDIIRMFDGMRVAESFLMKNHIREILLRKPAYLAGE